MADGAAPPSGARHWLLVAALLAAVALAYQPAWNGGLLWDDAAHLTRAELRSWEGLRRIWLEPGATQQYYPLLHSAFWLEHRLFGDAPAGYHVVNLILHVAAAALAGLALTRLQVPGAFLAAAIFALHPVQVESVAWISEQKNTLSTALYLGAALAWLRFEETRRARAWAASLSLFALALSSKAVAATLPAALLLVHWWKRGPPSWRRDVLPLFPFLVLGAAAGSVTAWVEHNNLGFALAGRGELDQAIAHYRRALQGDPGRAGVRFNLAMALLARGQEGPAVAELRRAVDLEPGFLEARNNLGILLARGGRLEEAIEQFQRALEIAPDSTEVRRNLGLALAARRRVGATP
ncbi:MAG TPA: tetratricopeptide repeat protein [Anaeromyxobacteraceae bacterium]|nr:tetratricopeptide repeat protein [Anaeromyxobacteraceae bacterium]